MAARFTPDEFLDHLLALPWLVGELVSPDLAWVAWSWYGRGPAADVYVVPTDGSAPPVRLTETPQNTHVVAWAADSRTLIVSEDKDGDERERLYLLDRTWPNALRLVADETPNYFLRGGKLAPDNRTLVYAANRDPDTGAEIEPYIVYAHDIVSGARRPLARPLKAGTGAPALNEQGTHILYTRKDLHPAGQQVWLVDIDGREDREILNFGPAVKVRASWLRDGIRAVVVAETDTHKRLGVWDRRDMSLRWLIDDPARHIEYAYAPRGTNLIASVETAGARTRAVLIDPDSGLESRIEGAPGTFLPLARIGEDWLGTTYSARQPRDIVRLAKTGTPQSLTRLWTATPLRPEDFVPAENVTWHAPDGLEIQGWLYRAAAPSRGLIVHVHGGPTAHAEDRVNPMIQYLVAAGFDVLEPNYRGSTGFGLPFREAIKKDGWGGAEQEDIRAGIEALMAKGIAQPGRVGITGTSYGGYSSWCAITRWPPKIVAAAAPICGMTDLVVDYYTTRPDLRPYSEEMLGGAPDQVPARYHERSPINFVDRIRGRLLIVQGARDPNVTPENMRAVRAALDRAGIAYDVLVFEDEGHGIVKPQNQKRLYRALVAFFGRAFGT